MSPRSASGLALAVLATLVIAAAAANGDPLVPPAHPLELETTAAPWHPSSSPSPWQNALLPERMRPSAANAGFDPLDVHWRSSFGLPVPNRAIRVLLPLEGVLIAGGSFTRIGSLEAPGIAAWDGVAWSRVGDYPGSNALELAQSGGLVALGVGAQGAGAWRWDGSSWHSLGTLPGFPLDMAVSGDAIAVSVGVYEENESRSRIFLHTGQGWAPLGDALPGTLQALAWYGGQLHAAGSLPEYQSAAVLRWNENSWESIDSELTKGAPGWVADLAVFGDELVACGALDRTDPQSSVRIATWNGSRWRTLESGVLENANFDRLRAIDGDLFVVGSFGSGFYGSGYGIARWDGTTWHVAEDALQVAVSDVASYQGWMYAGGPLSMDGSRPATPLVVREDSEWRPVLDPGPDMNGLLGWSGPMVTGLTALDGDIYAVGRFDFAGTNGGWRRCAGAARWNGREWSPVGFESFRYAHAQALTIHEGMVHAVGSFELDWSQSSMVARLESGGWTPVGAGTRPIWNPYTIASAHGDLFVGGLVESWSGYGGIARWDGSVWNTVGGGVTNGSWIAAIVAHGADVIVGGSFEEIGGVACRNIAAWNHATGWRPLGDGLDQYVADLLSRDGVLYAGGLFSEAGGDPVASGVARWRNGRWEAVSSRPAGRVWSLGWYLGRLLASGYDLPGWLASLEADGSWRPLGSGLDLPALDIVESGPSLFLGGFFSRAGAAPAYGFAEWREGEPFVSPLLPRVVAAPNPFASTVHLRYELSAGARVQVEVFDLAGQRVARVFEGFQSAGPQEVVWRPSSRNTPGVYFAQLTLAGARRVVRIVHVR